MVFQYDENEWIDEQKKAAGKKGWSSLTNKGKAGTLNQLASLADLGKKAFGYSPEKRAAVSAVLSNTPKVTKGRSKGEDLSVQDPTLKDKSTKATNEESAIIGDANKAYEEEKKRNGLT